MFQSDIWCLFFLGTPALVCPKSLFRQFGLRYSTFTSNDAPIINSAPESPTNVAPKTESLTDSESDDDADDKPFLGASLLLQWLREWNLLENQKTLISSYDVLRVALQRRLGEFAGIVSTLSYVLGCTVFIIISCYLVLIIICAYTADCDFQDAPALALLPDRLKSLTGILSGAGMPSSTTISKVPIFDSLTCVAAIIRQGQRAVLQRVLERVEKEKSLVQK